MPSIQSSAYPLAFRVSGNPVAATDRSDIEDKLIVRTVSRTLEGMQKEAIVTDNHSNSVWRMVCDEGAWLNGTDLSSFPLGFFAAGMASLLATRITALARQHNVNVNLSAIEQLNRYSMEGSALKKTMAGTALPSEITVHIDGRINRQTEKLIHDALAGSPAEAIMRNTLPGHFSITKNGRLLRPARASSSAADIPEDPLNLFDRITPADSTVSVPDIISKVAAANETVSDRANPVGYAHEQKRMVEVGSSLTMREDGLHRIQVQCIKPPGSRFAFLSDDPATADDVARAPGGLHYLSAGIAFCFMTQIGRYANIVKQDLATYRIVQDTVFYPVDGSAGPVSTHVFISSGENDDASRELVDMAEQTCYLHACYRGKAATVLHILNNR